MLLCHIQDVERWGIGAREDTATLGGEDEHRKLMKVIFSKKL
jgi:hypothetical protein